MLTDSSFVDSVRNSPIIISEILPADVAGLVDVWERSWLETYVNEDLGITREDILAKNIRLKKPFLEKKYASDNYNCYVSKEGDTVIGFIIPDPEKNSIHAIYVDPNFVGQGVGKKMMEFGLSKLDLTKEIIVEVASFNHRAIRFYEKFGFINTHKKGEPSILPSGKEIPVVKMVRRGRA